MNCFIIGNGFDKAHNMKTGYADFHEYIINRFPNLASDIVNATNTTLLPDGDIFVNSCDVASILCILLESVSGDDWNGFEDSLGKINLIECFDDLENIYDRDGERNLWHEAYNNEDRASDLSLLIPKIKELFSEWIESVEPAESKLKDFSKLIDPEDDLFITFNYTHTLEDLYGCKNVIHMHGESGQEIIVGHNGTQNFTEENPLVPTGCYDTLQHIYDELRKNVADVINRHNDELKVVSNCENIYSYGFSYSSVDLPYIDVICGFIKNKSVKWYNNYHDIKDIPSYEEKIRKSGFKGAFGTYKINKEFVTSQ